MKKYIVLLALLITTQSYAIINSLSEADRQLTALGEFIVHAPSSKLIVGPQNNHSLNPQIKNSWQAIIPQVMQYISKNNTNILGQADATITSETREVETINSSIIGLYNDIIANDYKIYQNPTITEQFQNKINNYSARLKIAYKKLSARHTATSKVNAQTALRITISTLNDILNKINSMLQYMFRKQI